MPAIPWSEFSRDELIELMHELEQCQCQLQPLWSESDIYLVSDCDCAPREALLPPRVLELRDRAIERMRKRQQWRESPLRRLLGSPFRRQQANQKRSG